MGTWSSCRFSFFAQGFAWQETSVFIQIIGEWDVDGTGDMSGDQVDGFGDTVVAFFGAHIDHPEFRILCSEGYLVKVHDWKLPR